MTCPVHKRKLLFGVAKNDADYTVQVMSRSGGKVVRESTCPFYSRWYDMLRRCYSKRSLIKRPTYSKVTVCDEWLTFSNFSSWMKSQDWEGKHLDKDLIGRGNSEYSPARCIFISPELNVFIKDSIRSKNNLMVGVSWHKRDKVFTSQCYDTLQRKLVHLGYFSSELEAHEKYLKYKIGLIPKLKCKGLISEEEENLLYSWYMSKGEQK